MGKNLHPSGGIRHLVLRTLVVIAMLVAVPLASISASEVKNWQGIALQKPATEGKYYIIKNRGELLWWALNGIGENDGIKLANDIYVQDDGVSVLAGNGSLGSNSSSLVTWPKVVADDYTEFQGNGHTIYGIYQNGGCGKADSRGSNDGYKYVGFLSYTDQHVEFNNFNIADSYISGEVAGGFIGQKSKNGVRTYKCNYVNSSYRGRVIGTRYAGGLVGWYRTDGQDARFYRCFNYGFVQSGTKNSKDTDTGAGGLIGYLDICHTAFAKAHTYFDRCVNYGEINCLTYGGSVGGQIGKVWDNNNGQREWRFCFNFGDVTKYDNDGKKLAGSGLLGNYQNANGNSQPKILSCGNARVSDTGSLLDSCVWNNKQETPLVVKGSKTGISKSIISSFTKDDSWAAWWSNNLGTVLVVPAIVVATAVGAAYLLPALGSTIASAGGNVAVMAYEAGMMSLETFEVVCTNIVFLKAAAMVIAGIAMAGGATMASKCAFLLNDSRLADNCGKELVERDMLYGTDDIKTGYFAFDANTMMMADSIDGKPNTDKSILFKQHIDMDNEANNDALPVIVSGNGDTADKLYFGYDHCNRVPIVSNDPNLLRTPVAHTFDKNGECTYCHIQQQPLDAVIADGKVDYYKVENYGNLNYLAAVFNGELGDEIYNKYKGATFKVTADIKAPDNAVWAPISSTTTSGIAETASDETAPIQLWHPFEGTFDGQGHTISGLRTSQYTNCAGLFGELYSTSNDNAKPTHAVIRNVRLSDCSFQGEKAGGIVGYMKDQGNGSVQMELVAVDNSVVVVSTGNGTDPCAGGLIGHYAGLTATANMCYSNAMVMAESDKAVAGAFVGYISQKVRERSHALFDYCYFAGAGADDLVGKVLQGGGEQHIFYNCFAVGAKESIFPKAYTYNSTINREAETNSRYMTPSQMANGRMAYELMTGSHTKNGNYMFKQANGYPDFDDSKMPSLYKVRIKMHEGIDGVVVGDTIINVNDETHLKAPLRFANQTFDSATLYISGFPDTKLGEVNDFSAIYDRTATDVDRTFVIYIDSINVPDTRTVANSCEWKGIPTLGGGTLTTIAADLQLTGENAFTITDAPLEIDGGYHKIVTDRVLMSDNTSRYNKEHPRYNKYIDIKNVLVVGDTLCSNTSSRKLRLENVIMKFQNGVNFNRYLDKSGSTAVITNYANTWTNVVAVSADSTKLLFFKNMSEMVRVNATVDVMATDKEAYDDIAKTLKDNGYDVSDNFSADNYTTLVNKLNTMYPGWQKVFGFRIEGKNEKMAGKFGFAAEPDKKVYGVKLYRQKDGLEDGSALMNYDGKMVLTLNADNSVKDVCEDGIPAGCFAVLPLTKAELGSNFKNLSDNIITKDGYARTIVLDDAQGGFAYPSCLGDGVTIHADRAEYKRSIYRDGLHETICMPFAFTSLEFDEGAVSDDDIFDICYLDPEAGGVDKANNVVSLKSIYSYYKNKYNNADYDPTQDETDAKFVGGVPYLISFTCNDNTEGKLAMVFVGNDVDLLREPSDVVAPLYGSFKQVAASDVAGGNTMMVLGVFEENGAKVEKFVKVKSTYRLQPYRAYLSLSSALAAKAMRLVIDDNGSTTGIGGVHADGKTGDGKTYDLSGRRIGKAGEHGVYIKNGKKIINLK